MTPIAEWVDLGLPSGTLWRRMNVGAERPVDYGLYYSWGNLDGYDIDSGHLFSQSAYNESPGVTINRDLQPGEDCARAALGARWRLPSASELQELVDCTTHSFVTISNIPCCVFSRNSQRLVIPLGGFFDDQGIESVHSLAFIWSLSYASVTVAYGLRCDLVTDEITIPRLLRYTGKPARAVYETLDTPLSLVVEQCQASSSSFYGKYIAFGISGALRYLIADWKTPSDDPGNEYGCRVFSNLADIDNPESAALPANQIYLTQAGEEAASLAAFISYYNEDNPKPIAGVISGGSAMSLIEGLLISPTAPV